MNYDQTQPPPHRRTISQVELDNIVDDEIAWSFDVLQAPAILARLSEQLRASTMGSPNSALAKSLQRLRRQGRIRFLSFASGGPGWMSLGFRTIVAQPPLAFGGAVTGLDCCG